MSRSSRRTRLSPSAACVIAAALASACTGDSTPLEASPEFLPEVPLPDPVTGVSTWTGFAAFRPDLQWSPDGATIFYAIGSGANAVAALDAQTGRTVTVAGGASAGTLRISADGLQLFYNTIDTDADDIHRLSTTGGTPQLVANDASPSIVTSADGRMLAWLSASDSIFVRDLVTGDTMRIEGAGDPLSLSPDHAQLVSGFERGFDAYGWTAIRVTTLTTGDETVLRFENEVVRDIRWGNDGMEVLSGGMRDLYITGADPASRSAIWHAPAGTIYIIRAAVWSQDGSAVALSISTNCYSGCHHFVLIIDIATRAATVVGSGNISNMGLPQFSPDGSRVAITGDGRLYLIGVPHP